MDSGQTEPGGGGEDGGRGVSAALVDAGALEAWSECERGGSGFYGDRQAAGPPDQPAAAADAWALAEAMAGARGDVPGGLRRWEASQLALGHQLLARVRDLGWRSQFGGGWRAGDPSLRFGLLGPGR